MHRLELLLILLMFCIFFAIGFYEGYQYRINEERRSTIELTPSDSIHHISDANDDQNRNFFFYQFVIKK